MLDRFECVSFVDMPFHPKSDGQNQNKLHMHHCRCRCACRSRAVQLSKNFVEKGYSSDNPITLSQQSRLCHLVTYHEATVIKAWCIFLQPGCYEQLIGLREEMGHSAVSRSSFHFR